MNILLTLPHRFAFLASTTLMATLATWSMGLSSLEAQTGPASTDPCNIELHLPGQMKDILSNVLRRVAGISNDKVDAFLADSETRFKTGDELLRAAAKHFGMVETKLAAEVRRMKHVNCSHAPIVAADGVIETIPDEEKEGDAVVELTDFARDVTLHVVLHEIGHALIREFDLPILANEEAMADAFATWYLTTHLPKRAPEVILARVKSLMIEAQAVPREKWPVNGEHNCDARRAYQIAAIAIAADRNLYRPVADAAGMSDNDMRKAIDYGAEIHRSWRRVTQPLMMPPGQSSREAGVDSELKRGSPEYSSYQSLLDELESVLQGFDWHSYVKIHLVQGDGGAAWSRSTRTITVHSTYIRRFIQQGRQADLMTVDKSAKSN